MSDLKHEVVSELKRVASETGFCPTRDNISQNSHITRWTVEKAFGTWSEGLKAAGLDKASQRMKEVEHRQRVKEFLSKPPEKVIEESKQVKKLIEHNGFKKIAIAGDLHFPFVCSNTLTAFYAFIEKEKPDVVVQIGDLLDAYSYSKFPNSKNIFTPKQEIDLGFKMAQDFWSTVRKIVPGVICKQILGNHDFRVHKRVLEKLPEIEHLFSINHLFTFEGVDTLFDTRESLVINGIHFIHGYMSRLGDHMGYLNANTVCGHSHLGGVVYRNSNSHGIVSTLWELNAGFMGDTNSKALSYTAHKFTRWTKGWGFIDEYGPRFIPA